MNRAINRSVLAGVFVVCFAAAGAAQTSVSQGVISLTLEDAVARGLRENVAGRLGEADLTSARGQRWTALQDLLPTARPAYVAAACDRLVAATVTVIGACFMIVVAHVEDATRAFCARQH